MASISVPANFGLEFLRIRTSDIELQLKNDKTLKANAVVLALNSPVIRDRIVQDNLPLDFKLFDKEPVNLFLEACYQGRLSTLEKEHMSQVHMISHKYQVVWIIDAVLDDFRARVKRCRELHDLDYQSAEFLFKEAVQVYKDMKKRNFVDVFIQQFGRAPEKRREFLGVFCKKMLMNTYSEDELKIAVEMSGSGELESVINAMVYHLMDRGGKGQGLDDNTRCLLRNINFVFLKEHNSEAHKEIFKVLAQVCRNFDQEDKVMIMEISFDDAQRSTSWDRNTFLPNLFTQPIESLEGDKRYDESTDSNDEGNKITDDQDDLQGLKAAYEGEILVQDLDCDDENDEQSMCCDVGNLSIEQVSHDANEDSNTVESSSGDEFHDSMQEQPDPSDPLNLDYTSERPSFLHETPGTSLDTAISIDEVVDMEEEECEQSTDSSNSDVVDTAEFKDRMYKLCESENVCSLYMLIEDLWYWILDRGGKRLDINFTDAMEIVKTIKIYRGWFPVSGDFVERLDNPSQNENLKNFRGALKEAKSLICADGDRISSRKDYCIRTMLQDNEGKIAFEYCPPDARSCKLPGNCGFLFKASTSSNGQFEMKLCYAKPEYNFQNLHFHDNLIFAQRMHVMLTGRNGPRFSYPLSWEGKPVLDENRDIIRWGRHRFTENSEAEPQGGGKVYNWQPSDKARFEVYYCTD